MSAPMSALFIRRITGTHGRSMYTLDLSVLTGVASPTRAAPVSFTLQQNYPNPFNPATAISYSVNREAFVQLMVFDVLGRKVATLVNERLPAGSYQALFNGEGLASGVYWYRLQAGDQSMQKKMVLVR
ncbi:hypothetical protein DCC62_17790 [candidate division KSB1 bacterium]|nr:MAG: hypothetical protein DCC62_17790 [candidate division KSB1 bacterium]